jgi:hypothetical protein
MNSGCTVRGHITQGRHIRVRNVRGRNVMRRNVLRCIILIPGFEVQKEISCLPSRLLVFYSGKLKSG